jgi:hypothetical protein
MLPEGDVSISIKKLRIQSLWGLPLSAAACSACANALVRDDFVCHLKIQVGFLLLTCYTVIGVVAVQRIERNIITDVRRVTTRFATLAEAFKVVIATRYLFTWMFTGMAVFATFLTGTTDLIPYFYWAGAISATVYWPRRSQSDNFRDEVTNSSFMPRQ